MTKWTRKACIGTLLLGGCNFAPKYEKPKPDLPATFKTSGIWKQARPDSARSNGGWWSLFGDAELNALMKKAEAGSPTLEMARHRLEEAQALSRADRSGLFPTAGVFGSARRNRSSGSLEGSFAGGRTITRLRGTLDLAYELDFWGRARNVAASGAALAEAAEADYRSALLLLQGELAMNWFALRTQDAEIALLRRATELRRKNLDLAQTRFQQGDIAQLDVAQAETELAETESEAIGLEKERAELEHAIALLLGTTPANLNLKAKPLEGSPPVLPKAVPSDLLERRPDVASAEREMAALNAEIGVAKAALFPNISLGLSGGTESSFVDQLLKSSSKVWGIGPELDWPVFDAGKRRAEVDAARARYDQTAARYKSTVLEAVRDVEDAASGISILSRQAESQRKTVAAAERTVDLAQKRYDSGLVAFFEVLDAQRTLLRVEQDLNRIDGGRFLSTVLLVKALGGGW